MLLSNLRKNMGLSQRQLSRLLGLTSSAVNQYESGKRQPNAKTMLKLAEVLNVDCETILKCFASEEEVKVLEKISNTEKRL